MINRCQTGWINDSSFHLSISYPIFPQYYMSLGNYSLVLVYESILIILCNVLFTVWLSLSTNVCLNFQLFAAMGCPGCLVLYCDRPQAIIVLATFTMSTVIRCTLLFTPPILLPTVLGCLPAKCTSDLSVKMSESQAYDWGKSSIFLS